MRRSVSTKGSHSFIANICRLLAMELIGLEPSDVIIAGEPPRFCGGVIRYINATAKFVMSEGTVEQLALFGEISRPCSQTGSNAWRRAVVHVTIANQEWLAYVKRNSDLRLVISGLWRVSEAATA